MVTEMTSFNPVKLIDEIKKRPGLWSTDHPTDRDEKLALWKEVASNLYANWHQYNKATAYDRVLKLQRKWRSLRDAYSRELRARRSGQRVNKRVYIYFKRMSYLGGFEGPISDDDFLDEKYDDTLIGDSADEAGSDPLVSDNKVKTKKKLRKKRAKIEKTDIEESEPHEEISLPSMPVFNMEMADNDTDSDKLFLLSFLPEMKQLPLHIKMWVRAQIAGAMQEAVSSQYANTMPGTSNRDIIKIQMHDS